MTNTCARCGVDIRPLGFNSGLWASTSTGGTGCTVDGVTARHAPVTDQPTTPTVDTDEYDGTAFTEAREYLRQQRLDGQAGCYISPATGQANSLLSALVIEHDRLLARPVPAAPAEPGATEVWMDREDFSDLLYIARSAGRSVLPATNDERRRVLGLAAAALAAPPAPADEGRDDGHTIDVGPVRVGMTPSDADHARWLIAALIDRPSHSAPIEEAAAFLGGPDTVTAILAARPAPEPAAPTEEEAP